MSGDAPRNGPYEPPRTVGDASPDQQERRIRELVDEFLERLQVGETPDPCEIILSHPAIAQELEQRLNVAEAIHRLGEFVRSAEPDPARRLDLTLASPVGLDRTDAASHSVILPPGCQLGPYTIQAVLGRGSSAVVYRALDTKLTREVALKVILSEGACGADLVDRFHRDARIAASLRHPNIVPLHGIGEHDGLHFIDSMLIPGETLEARLRREGGRPLDFVEAAGLVGKIAEALDYAHRAGIVHRDVKPSNILIDEQGEPQLTDFSLARYVDGPTLTLQGQILGTPGYMSPEQAEGRSHEADARSDAYSLGVVLYRLITGRLPFADADSLATLLARIVHAEPPRPRTLNPAIPRDLETICLKAMEKRPADRFASAGALADELRRWRNQEPLTIRPPTSWEKLRRWARRNRLAATIALGSVLLLAVVGGSLGVTAWNQALLAREARMKHALESRYRALTEARALIDQALQRLRVPSQGRRTQSQEILRKLAEPLRLIPAGPEREAILLDARSAYAATLGAIDLVRNGDDEVELPVAFYQSWRVALHPDGNLLAIGTHRGPIRWIRGQKPRIPPDLDRTLPRPRLEFSPDGRYLAFTPVEGGVELWDGGVTKRLASWHPPRIGAILDMSFAGSLIRVITADGRLETLSLPELRAIDSRTIPAGHPPLSIAAFSPDVSRLAIADGTNRVSLLDASGRGLRALPPGRIDVTALAWSRDNRLVALATQDGVIQVWDVAEGSLWYRFAAFTKGTDSVLFHPDGQWLLAGSSTEKLIIWNVATGERIRMQVPGPWDISRDGRLLATGNAYRVGFCDWIFPEVVETLSGHLAAGARIAWSRDNRHLVTLDTGFEVRVWDAIRGVTIDHFRPPAGSFSASNAAVAISDDARLVAYASGGEPVSRASIRDVRRQETLAEWELSPAFERMTYADGRFLLVREELADPGSGSRARRTVLREMAVGKEPGVVRAIRAPEADDESGFITSSLTSDGSRYLWVGPRLPLQNRRAEVRDVSTGRLIRRVPMPEDRPAGERYALLRADGQMLWTDTGKGWIGFDLGDTEDLPERVPEIPVVSPGGDWWVFAGSGTFDGSERLFLQPGAGGKSRFWLAKDDPINTREITFSHEGRYLSWFSQDGTITVADLPALEGEVRVFERSIAAE